MDTSLKRRHRIPSSCSVCRKRKSRCDRVKPVCGSCRKKSIAHLCYYENDDDSDSTRKGSRDMTNVAVMEVSPATSVAPPAAMVSAPGSALDQPPSDGSQTGVFSYYPGGIPSTESFGSTNSQIDYSSNHASISGSALPQAPPGLGVPGPPSVHSTTASSFQYEVPYHHIAPPPTGPPAPNNIPIMSHQSIPSINYYDDGEGFRPQDPKNVQLPPIKNSNDRSMVVSIGPNSQLRIDPNDEIEAFFDNASFPLSLEGPYLQNHGFLTYVGLTKSDRFVKFFRKFAVELLKKGEIAQFIPKKKRKKTSNESSPQNKRYRSSQHSTPGGGPKSGMSQDLTSMDVSPRSEKFSPRDTKRTPKEDIASPAMLDDDRLDVEIEPNRLLTNEHNGRVGDDSNGVLRRAPGNGDTKNGHGEEEKSEKKAVAKKDSTEEQEEGEGEGEEEEEEEGEEEEEEGEEEDILVITRINIAKDEKDNMEKKKKEIPLSILPGLKALYSGRNSRKEYYKIVEKALVSVFPSKFTVIHLFDRFMKWVYPFIPIVNQDMVMKDFYSVTDQFLESEDGRHTSFNIKSDKHLNILGIMLVTLRLGYLSLIHNHRIHNQYSELEISIVEECKSVSFQTFADVVNLCIPDEHTSSISTFRMVQLLSLVYFYRQVAPNDCHGVGAADSQILFGTTVRHALSIGLNRDPLKFFEHETINKNKELIECWRSMWHYLAVTDAATSMHRSSILSIYDAEVSDVAFPNYMHSGTELEETFRTINKISKSYRKICKILSNFQKKPRIIDILAETNILEHIFLEFFGKDFFKDYICKSARESTFQTGSKEHEESYLKIVKYLTFISLRANLSSVYYVIALNYERKYNDDKTTSISSGVELFKIHFKSVVQLVYIMSYVFDNSVELFGKNYDYVLTAANERYMIKTHSFLTSFFIRLIHQKQLLTFKTFEPDSAERLQAINQLFNLILVEAELFVGNFRLLSLRYVNSYKIYVLTYYVLKQCMQNAEVFFAYALSDVSTILDTTNMLQYFSASEIKYLCKLCEEFRFAKDNQHRQRRANEMFNMNFQHGGTFEDEDLKDKPTEEEAISPSDNRGGDVNGMEKDVSSVLRGQTDTPMGGLDSVLSSMNFGSFSDANFKSDDFMKFFELYGDPSNPHLE